MKKQYDVVIIGGGLSGLAAAVRLSARKLRVAIVEQSARLGGRCYSYTDERTGDVVDNGQHVLLGAYHHTLEYLELAGTEKLLRREPTLSLPLIHPSKGFTEFKLKSLPRPLHLTAGMLQFSLLPWADRRKLFRVGKALQFWTPGREKELARMSVDGWLRSLHQSEEALRCLWHPIAVSVMNEIPSRASALVFARSLRAAFLSKKSDSALLLPTVGQTDLYVTGILERLRREHVDIALTSEVKSLGSEGGSITGVSLHSGETVRAEKILSAVPYYALARILPAKFKRAEPFSRLHEFTSSPIISLHLWFERDFMPMEYAGLIDGTVQWVFNRRRITRTEGRLEGYLSCVISGAHALVDRPKEDIVRLALDDLHIFFPDSRRLPLRHSVVIKEKRATFSPSNRVEPLRPGTATPLKNLFLAGDWTNTGLPATIEGAVLSGFTAAETLLRS